MIGVGSLDQSAENVAAFSSRGMSTWSLLDGYGIMKPDVLTYGTNVRALSSQDDEMCTLSSGISISSSIISASTALALSQLKDRKKV